MFEYSPLRVSKHTKTFFFLISQIACMENALAFTLIRNGICEELKTIWKINKVFSHLTSWELCHAPVWYKSLNKMTALCEPTKEANCLWCLEPLFIFLFFLEVQATIKSHWTSQGRSSLPFTWPVRYKKFQIVANFSVNITLEISRMFISWL